MVWRKRHKDRKHGSPHFEELEPRILYSADLVPQAESPTAETVVQVEETPTEGDTETALVEEEILYLNESGEPTEGSPSITETTQPLEVVFIDASVPEYQSLMDGIQSSSDAQIRTFLLDNSDGFEQLQSALESLENISAIHLITHGDDASFQLGADEIHSGNAGQYQQAFANLSEKLTADADLLFYGCNIAESSEGQQLLDNISQWTGADVAASTDVTGHGDLGGDWILEYQRGHVETSVVVSTANQLRWHYALDTVSGLVGHWTLDSNANDSTSNSYNGTLTGNAAIDTATPSNQIGSGKLSLDGAGDYVDLTAHSGALDSLNNGTVSLWVNFTANGLMTAFNVSDAGSGDRYAVLAFDDGTPYFKVKDTATLLEVDAVNPINDGNWHHVAITVDGTGNKLYVDGVQATGGSLNYVTGSASTTAFFGDISSVDAAQIGINQYDGGFSWDFNGLIDDVRVYNRALSSSDIGEIVAAATPLHTIEVTTTSDVSDGDTSSLAALNAYKGADGKVSLREAIEAANNTANSNASTPDEIHFNISDPLVNGAHTISLSTALPNITDAVIIDGTTDPDYSSSPVIQIDDGTGIAYGLRVNSSDSTIEGLSVTGFNEAGIFLAGNNNTAIGNYVGLNADGSLDGDSQKHGILVGGSNNTIGGTTAADRNYVVDHTYAGITLNGGSADNNHVLGNYIGVMPDGSTLAANTNFSIYTANGAQNNIIGTDGDGNDDALEGNVIAGSNLNYGGAGASGTVLAGNKIGTDASGTVRLGGTITINGDSNTRIGTDNDGTSDALEANIIATQINISGNATVATIAGNYIGVQADGNTSFGSSNGGIIVNSDATVTIGGTSSTEANVIAHNSGDGVQINSTGATVSVLGNSIFGNTASGIDIVNDGPNQNDAEDADTGTNNLLNFPVLTNVAQNGANLDIDFAVDLPAGNYRIEFFDNPAGLDASGYGQGQQFIGFANITVTGAIGYENFSTTLNSVTASDVTHVTTTATEADGGFANFGATSEFGPQFDGQHVITVTTTSDISDGDTSSITALLGNRGADGEISLREAMEAADNTANINASTPDQIHFDITTTDANYSAGTNSWRIQLASVLPHIDEEVIIDATTQSGYDGTPSIELDGSFIGGGSDNGFITDADELVIRGFAINGFTGYGIHLSGSGGHIIESNYIGTDVTGNIAKANNAGIYIGSGADNVQIGSSGKGNLISGNTTQGIYINSTNSVTIVANLIGTNADGTVDLGNGSSGIRLDNADGNTIGGTTAAERNVISGNDTRGIYVSNSDNNVIQGNYIGTNAAGNAAIGNINAGVRLSGGSSGNTIGGAVAGSGNVISGNADGIYIQDGGTTGNSIFRNYIGTDASGLLDVGNLDRGIQLESGADANIIGGTTAAQRNIISGNETDGIIISNGATDNIIQGNWAGLGSDGSTALGNGDNGIRITTPNDNLIGGATAGAGNVIAHSSGDGINISPGVDNSVLGNSIYNSGGEAIDLGNNGVTSNDPNDSDTGANNYQNYPVLTKAELAGSNLTLDGTLDTDWANTQYRIEFFGTASGDADPTHGEARYYLGSTTITTDGMADGSFTGVVLSGVTLAIGDVVSATATKIDAPAMVGINELLAYGNSSELSANFIITEVNVAPTDITPNSFDVDEFTDTSGGHSLGTLSSTDANVGNTFTYTLIGGPDQAKFSIGGAGSDELILTDGVLDVDTQASYSVTVRTTDQGGLFYSESITVTVNNVNEAPVITSVASDTVAEDATLLFNAANSNLITLADPDAGANTLQVTLDVSNGTLTLGSTAGLTSVAGDGSNSITLEGTIANLNNALDGLAYQGTLNFNGADTLSIGVDDQGNTGSGGALTDSTNIAITVTPVNDEESLDTNAGLTLNEGATATVTSARLSTSDVENAASTIVYTVDAIPVNGQLKLSGTTLNNGETFTQNDINNNRITYEHFGTETNSDSFDFTVDDGAGTSSSATFNITVTLLNENAPVITPAQSFPVSELATNGTSVGTVTATDIDTGTTLQSWSITAGNSDSIFAINASSGEITIANNSNLDFDTTASYTLSLTVSDGTNTSAVETVTINITDVATAITAAQSFSVSESASNGAAVGTVATTGDSPKTFSITAGNTGLAFAIDNSGNITVNDATAIDFETLNSYSLTIQTSDGTTPVSETITVNITDINDGPVANAGGPYTIAEGDSLSLNASASSDADGDALTISWDMDNDGSYDLVNVSSMGTLNWTTLQSYGLDDDGSYTIVLRVEDGNGGVDTQATTVTISNTAPTLSTTGNATVAEDAVYTLNLGASDPGNDSITGWVINWGDGSIETFAGNPALVTHVYTQPDLTYNILAAAIDEDGTFHQNDLLIPAFNSAEVLRFAATTGNHLQTFADGTGLTMHTAAILGLDGNLYVSGYSSDNVQRFNAATGAYIDTFVATGDNGLNGPTGLAFGPDGHLYVSSYDTGDIYRYDGSTGEFIDKFITKTTGGLNNPEGLLFGQDGKLYVADYNDNEILRFDAYTGEFIDTFVSAGSGGLSFPEQMTFGPDGNLYVASYNDTVLRYDGNTGAFIDQFVTTGDGGLFGTVGIAFGPDGHLYVSSHENDRVIRYDGSTGAYMDTYVGAGIGGLDGGYYPLFLPQQRVTVTPVNDAPTATIAPASYATAEDSAPIALGGVSISDIDSGVNNLEVTLSVSNGQLSLADTTGLTLSAGSNNSNSMSWTGTQSSLNAALATLTYQSNNNFFGADTFTLLIDDLGSTGGGSLTDSDTATINVSAVNDAPVVTPAQSFNASELATNGTSVGMVSGSDVDPATTLQNWSITAGNSDGIFAINTSTGEITIADNSNLDFDTSASYNLSITVSDGSATSTAETVAININDAATAITAGQNFVIAESASNGTAVGTVVTTGDAPKTFSINAGNTGSAFAINNSGNITVADETAIDYETLSSYTLTVQASDGTTPVSETVTVTITDVNENGVGSITDTDTASNAVDENVVPGSNTGITAAASDPDGTDTVSYSLSDDAGGLFGIDTHTGVVTVTGALDAENATSHDITVVATSFDGSTQSRTFTLQINDLDEFNVGPVNDADVASNTVAEDATIDTVVGITALATDADVSDNVSYSLSDDAGGRFAIDTSTGVITVAGALDYETATAHNITVVATSDDGSTSSLGTTILIIDRNDIAPDLSDASVSIAEDASGTPVLHDFNDQVSGSDVDAEGEAVNYSIIAGNDNGLFALDSTTGVVTLVNAAALDYESSNAYVLDIQATDGSLSNSVQLSIQITNVNEAPVISPPGALTTDEDTPLAITDLSVADPDAGNSDLEITLTASNGVMSLGEQSGLSSVPVSDNLDQFVLRGSATAMNQALSGLKFTPNADFNGNASITVVANDLGNTGTGTALTDSETLSITVIPVNDEPLLDVPDEVEILPGEAIEFTTALDNLAPLQDLDSQSTTHNLSLSIDNASLSISDDALITLVTQESASQLTASGDLSTINRLLNALVITPETGFSGQLTLNLQIEDEGSASVGASRSISTQVHFYVPAPVIVVDEPKTPESPSENQSEAEQLVLIEFEEAHSRQKPETDSSDDEVFAIPALQLEFNLGAQATDVTARKPLADIFAADEQNQWLLSSKAIKLRAASDTPSTDLLDINSLNTQTFSPSLQGFIDGLEGDTTNTEISLGVRLAEISGAGLVVGSVVWLLKSSSLLSSLLVSYPAWRGMDPLPVLLPKGEEPRTKNAKTENIQERPKNQRFRLSEEPRRIP